MLTVVVCVGSSCYVRGSEKMAETFERLIRERGLNGRVELTGAFCMEQCSMGVSVRVGDKCFAVWMQPTPSRSSSSRSCR